ncbi:S1C family serine protease [Nocardioides aurantiacus]|uniref:Putative serine protease PepD n=1 Tax=Nocardioides aurantiacus TaxID=86796 RepID=A0A3N2CZ07_9ACTN|nr:trypsin-like peptidase domain-containing protein [Nocardioides aurantiacus]ROR92760.1 putative serine protease PepD [Nocardioides aurantiacus]
MTEQNPPQDPYQPSGPQGPRAPQDGDEHTRPLPPHQPAPQGPPGSQGYSEPPIWQGSYPPPPQDPYASPALATVPPRARGRKYAAALLVGALLVGGGAGVGGAALYDAVTEDGATGATTSGGVEATKTAVVEDGTVEKVSSAVLPSVVKVNVSSSEGAGSGSGIVLSKDGEILTNNHVVAGAGEGGDISVSLNDGTTLQATVVGTDPLVDIAVIKARGATDLTPASIGKSGDLSVGQSVVAIGSPFGLNATVTSGIVSALNRPVSVGTDETSQQGQSTTYPAIQTDAAINPGNSGGPLVDLSGRVVGINSSIRTSSSSSLSGGQGGSIGLGFAIPMDEVLPIVNQILDGDTPTHARLGVSVGDTNQGGQGGQGGGQAGQPSQGALVSEVEDGGAADSAGLRDGDVITKVDDEVIDGSESLVATIRGHRPGDDVTITYVRDGRTATTRADLGSDAGTPAS